MKILICGDRNWNNFDLIFNTIKKFVDNYGVITIVQGECKGADRMGKLVAQRFKIPCKGYPADWGKYGKKAGPMRNEQMLVEECPDIVIAFHNNIESSKGTKDGLTP